MKQRGFSLAEVLVSLVLSSLIAAALGQFYLQIKAQYLQAETLLNKQLELLWVRDLLADSIRRAGFTPCKSIDSVQAVDRRYLSRKLSAIEIAGSSLQVNRMSEMFYAVNDRDERSVIIAASTKLNPKKPLLIADCQHAEIQEIAGIEHVLQGTRILLKKPLIFAYDEEVYVGEWIEERWYIKTQANKIPALYYDSGMAEALTDAIRGLEINKVGHQVQLSLLLDQGPSQKLVIRVRG